MAWGFRRSMNFGPLRINASKSGLGYSIGGRGFRIGKDARGRNYTYASIPGTGIYNKQYLKPSHSTPPKIAPPIPVPPPPFPLRVQQAKGRSVSVLSRSLGKVAVYGAAAVGLYAVLALLLHLL